MRPCFEASIAPARKSNLMRNETSLRQIWSGGHDAVLDRGAGAVHKTGQYVIYAVVGLHVVAALYHHFVKRDGVLRRMLPLRGAADD